MGELRDMGVRLINVTAGSPISMLILADRQMERQENILLLNIPFRGGEIDKIISGSSGEFQRYHSSGNGAELVKRICSICGIWDGRKRICKNSRFWENGFCLS